MKRAMMNWSVCTALALLALMPPHGRAQQGLQTRMILDPAWHMPAAKVSLPAGWKFDAVIAHGESCVTTLPGIRYAASSPDGLEKIQAYPEITYSWSSDMQGNQRNQASGCLLSEFFQPKDFLLHVIAPQLQPGAQAEAMTAPASFLQQAQADASR